MEIDIFSECAYTTVGIRQLIKQTGRKNAHRPALAAKESASSMSPSPILKRVTAMNMPTPTPTK